MIHYKLLKSKLTGNVFPQQVMSQLFDTKLLKEKLAERYGSIAAAVLDEAVKLIGESLAEGRTVSIDDLGTFSLRLGMSKAGVKYFEDVRTQDIRLNGVRFNAAKSLRQRVARQEIHLQRGDKVRRTITAADRWTVLYSHILEEFVRLGTPVSEVTVSVSSYRFMTGCTDYTSRKELAQYCKEGKLRELTARHHKIYVLSAEWCEACRSDAERLRNGRE